MTKLMLLKYAKLAPLVILLITTLLFAALWRARGDSIELLQSQIELNKAAILVASAEASAKAKATEVQYQTKLAEVNENAIIQIKAANAAASSSYISVVRLRDQTTRASAKLPTASADTAIDYALTCGAVLDTMAEAGRGIAAKADEHRLDADRLVAAWPTDTPVESVAVSY